MPNSSPSELKERGKSWRAIIVHITSDRPLQLRAELETVTWQVDSIRANLEKKKKIILVSQKNCVMMRFLAITFFEKTNKGEYSVMHNCEPTVEVSKNCCVSASHEEYLYK